MTEQPRTAPLRIILRRHRLYLPNWGRRGTFVKCDADSARLAALDLQAAGVTAVVECSMVQVARIGELTLGRWEDCRCFGPDAKRPDDGPGPT